MYGKCLRAELACEGRTREPRLREKGARQHHHPQRLLLPERSRHWDEHLGRREPQLDAK
jgi:hypothetical protein